MKTFKVTTWFLDSEVVFLVSADTASQAMKIVNEKPATELLNILKVQDMIKSMSVSIDNDSST